jgi:type I restriction-modification system DNA methylase subunit
MTITEIRKLLESPYNQKDWKQFLQTHFTNNKLYGDVQTIQLQTNPISSHCVALGNYEVDEYTRIGIFEIQINDKVNITRNRVALRNILKHITAQVAGAMVVFVQGDKWRFSYISKRKVKNKNTNQIEDKETAPKRYTYLFGKNEKALTAATRFDKLIQKQKANIFQYLTLNDFEEAFSVEKLSKEFFKQYKDTYEDFVQFLTGKRYKKSGNKYAEQVVTEPNYQLRILFDNNEKQARDFCKRMMGRIVFLYFIQKKGWLAVEQNCKWGEGNMNYMVDLFTNSKYQNNFYSAELVPLFFKTLNNPDSENTNSRLRFPYLNGGLFDDGQDKKHNKLQLPEDIFNNLFSTFNNYNFTVHEDAPDEHTVAVDPEMLGHIFENLLEDNKDKGAFYTPKEIVHYMCQQSLVEHIASTLNNPDKIIIEKLIQQVELLPAEENWAKHNAYAIIDVLEKVRICDPAIGSGAFPMGLLQEIFNLMVVLHNYKGWGKKNEAEIKKHIIQESIYGVDIDAGAVDIARLRFWLSLVVDEEQPQPLPNLDFKIMQGNSLLGIPFNTVIDVQADQQFEDYKDLYFAENNPERKKELKEKINTIIQQILQSANQYSSYHIDFDFKLFFSEVFHSSNPTDKGFDIVIGNPPYGAKLSKQEKKLFKDMYSDVHMRTPDTFNYFISKSFTLLRPNGVISFIVPNNLLFQNENTKTRSLLINTNYLQTVINLGDNTFESADVPTCIFIGLKKKVQEYEVEYSDKRKELIENIDFYTPQKILLNTEINNVPDLVIGVSGTGVKLIKDIEEKSWKIDEIALEAAYGASSGSDKIFRVTRTFAEENNFETDILKPVLVGGEIDRYKIQDTKHVLIYTARDTKISNYPEIEQYLKMFQAKLTSRSEARDGIIPWYCLLRQRSPKLFEEEKIVMRQTSDRIRATIDLKGFYCMDSIMIFKINPLFEISYKYALTLLNSKLNNFMYKNITQEEGRVFAQVKPQNVRKLFIPKILSAEQKVFEILSDYLMFLNEEKNQPVSQSIDNKALAYFIQQVTDACICELIFAKEMKEKKVNILAYVREEIAPFNQLPWEVRKAREIFETYQKWTLPNSEVRNRLKLISLMCPDTAGIILSENEQN